ncbi:Serine/Threonine protein kinase, partial [Reticulomyxa filosa]
KKKKAENEKETFSSTGCYNKEWISLTNKLQKLETVTCRVCNQIANNAVELQCGEDESVEHAYLYGEECLQTYLKQNDGKCPIHQRNCFNHSKSKTVRKMVSELLVICPRQYDLNKKQPSEGTNSGEKEEQENGTDWNLKNQCNYRGAIKEMKGHLDKSCQLISIKQLVSLEVQNQLSAVNEQIKKLQQDLQSSQNTIKELQSQLEKVQIKEELKEKQPKSENENENENENESDNKKFQQFDVSFFFFFFFVFKRFFLQLKLENEKLKLGNEKLKLERELNGKKQSEEISKIQDDYSILKQQQNAILTELENLKKKVELKNSENKITRGNDSEDGKENSTDNDVSNANSRPHTGTSSAFKLLKTFTGHTAAVYSIDYSAFGGQFLCSGSYDKTVRIWDVETSKQIQLFSDHSSHVTGAKFSPYHYHYNRRNVICSSSDDKTIRFWDVKDKQPLKVFNEHTGAVCSIAFSPFDGRHLCSGSFDKTIRLWDVETFKLLYVFKGHTDAVCCLDFSPSQGNKNNGVSMSCSPGRTFCSGSYDKIIRIWDIETNRELTEFKGHGFAVSSVKYGSNELKNIGGANTILSGSWDHTVRLWDARSSQQTHVFNGHKDWVYVVEYSPLVANNSKIGGGNVICSGSKDNTIRFWDIRSSKTLDVIKIDEGENGMRCLKFLSPKTKEVKRKSNDERNGSIHLCCGSDKGPIRVWEQ